VGDAGDRYQTRASPKRLQPLRNSSEKAHYSKTSTKFIDGAEMGVLAVSEWAEVLA
jgi:hypothetical protein